MPAIDVPGHGGATRAAATRSTLNLAHRSADGPDEALCGRMTQRGISGRERRRHPRALTNLRATVTIDGKSHAAKVINLSMGGALLDLGATPLPSSVEAGHPITLEIRCLSRGSPLHADARAVLWHRTAGPAPLLAVQFEPLADEATEHLAELMDEALWQLRGRILAAAASRPPSPDDDATVALTIDD